MEDQGKRLLIAVALAFALLWAWNLLFPTKAPDKKKDADETAQTVAGSGSATGSGSAVGAGAGSATRDAAPVVAPEAPRGEEDVAVFEFDEFIAEFSSYGGTLRSWRLKGEQFENRHKSPPEPLELVPTNERGSNYYTLQLELGDGPLAEMSRAEWTVVERGPESIAYRWEGADLEVTKKFRVDHAHNLVDLQIDVVPKTSAEIKHQPLIRLFGFQDPALKTEGGMTTLGREWKAACLMGDSVKQKSAKDLGKRPELRDGHVRWGGFGHSYFVVATALDETSRMGCENYAVEGYPGAMSVTLRLPAVVSAGVPYSRRVVSYLGPKFSTTLEHASTETGFDAGFEEAIDLGWLGFLSGPLLWLLTLFQTFTINWGLAIVFLTVVIKLVLLPLTHKSIKSMKGMSKLRPQMEKLKEKHGDDKQKLQVETMNLFKTHGVNPLAGCLPMLLQAPIWFALYRMLMAAGELYQAPFIPGWIDDLTAPDPYYALPLVVMAMMFFQTRLTPTTATGMQAKILMYGMPLMFGFFCLFFPAGLALYIFTNTGLTLIHYYFVHKEDRVAAKHEKKNGPSAKADGDEGEGEGDEDADGEEQAKGEAKIKPQLSGQLGSSKKSGKGSRGGRKNSKKKKKKKSDSGN